MIKVLGHYEKGLANNSMLKFSGGELQVTVGPINRDPLKIDAHLTSSEDILELMLVVDAIRRQDPHIDIELLCPYLPYARQDRVMEPGEALGAKVMCDIINSLKFTAVEVWDVHSDVSLALLDRVIHRPLTMFVQRVPVDMTNVVLVAPDAGALKKVLSVAKAYGREMVRADKLRSTKDGSITGTKVYSDHVGKKDFLILDDICDGGRTFIELAKELRPLTDGKIFLYVTHGIFSNGFEPFSGLIDHIYTAMPFPNVDLTNPIITKINLEY